MCFLYGFSVVWQPLVWGQLGANLPGYATGMHCRDYVQSLLNHMIPNHLPWHTTPAHWDWVQLWTPIPLWSQSTRRTPIPLWSHAVHKAIFNASALYAIQEDGSSSLTKLCNLNCSCSCRKNVSDFEVSWGWGGSKWSLKNYGFICDAIFFTCSHMQRALSNET